MNWEIRGVFLVDCLQSAFSLKMRLVLISSSAIANHVTITETPSFPSAPDFTARVLRFRVQWLCKEKQETARSLYSWVFVVDCALAFQIVTLDLISGQYLKCRGVVTRGFSLHDHKLCHHILAPHLQSHSLQQKLAKERAYCRSPRQKNIYIHLDSEKGFKRSIRLK